MKIPLHYQLSNYDCGPTSMLNAIGFLFEREDVPPEVIRNIMLYSLDCYSTEGKPGRRGTSCSAMMFLSSWLNDFGKLDLLSISSEYLSGEQVFLGQQSRLSDALHRGGAAVVRLFYDEWHYVLFTGEKDNHVYLFDPYYRTEPFPESDIQIVNDHPFEYNRIVPSHYFNSEEEQLYSFAAPDIREAVLLFNKDTKLTPDSTIEYFI
jgi:hypothetical protein